VKHRFRSAIAACAFAFSSAPVLAQAPAPVPAAPAPAATPARPAAPPLPGADEDANPALWVVRDEDTTIYLFGTIHMLDGRTWFNDEVKTAFDASDELVMEAILPEDQMSLVPMIMRYAIDQSGITLSSRLTPAENAQLARATASLGIPPAAFDRFEPWFAGMMLSVTAAQRSGIDAANGPETVLTRAATARHIPIRELEGFEWQIHLFDNMPPAFQLATLREALRQAAAGDQVLAPLVGAWSKGDVGALEQALDDPHENPTLRRVMLTNRNANWAIWIRNRLARPGTVFIAVGAAHLAGSDSVQVQLRNRGIASERVPHGAAR
jgi:uncharacterized protein YbaP (TraB family)